MPTFFERKLLPPTAAILLAVAAVISGGQAVVAANVRAVYTATSWQGSENLLLAKNTEQFTQANSGIPSRGPGKPVPLPARIPEPSTVVGLGLVAGSLALTRRRVRVKN
ncbi:PEP-CTERM sorting domain-containing protein [Microcoleus sp. B5-D4]|uniref:PEP-CTERM sorting domain-containing protein n=1 Tax=unclassified Microcoleus TaxID=2642155 RepID=UPI002FCEC872